MRAVQFNAVHDNHRAIRYLHSVGASMRSNSTSLFFNDDLDLDHRNKQNCDVYSYCQTTELRRFLQGTTTTILLVNLLFLAGIPKTLYKVNVEVCSVCRFLHFCGSGNALYFILFCIVPYFV